MILEGEDFDALTEVPDGEWTAYSKDFMDDWYNYSGAPDHVVTPKDKVYVLRNGDGHVWKIQITNYYNDAGTSGYPTFLSARLDDDG